MFYKNSPLFTLGRRKQLVCTNTAKYLKQVKSNIRRLSNRQNGMCHKPHFRHLFGLSFNMSCLCAVNILLELKTMAMKLIRVLLPLKETQAVVMT